MDLNLSPKPTIQTKAEKNKEYKFLGSVKQHRGLRIFAKDSDGKVFEVPVIDKKVLDLSKGQGQKEAHINPTWDLVWALNLKNAVRKFSK